MSKEDIFSPVPAGGDWRRNAVLEHRDDHAIAIGFAETAQLIIDHWVNRGPNDLLFEPLVFSHRHALELVLKEAIRQSAARLRFHGQDDPKVAEADVEEWLVGTARHNIHKLAHRLDELLCRLDEDSLPAETNRVLMSLHELDPSGETFRYGKVKTKGGRLENAPRPLLSDLPDELQAHVDVVAMHEHFRSAFSLLSGGLMTVLDEIAQFQHDLAQDVGW